MGVARCGAVSSHRVFCVAGRPTVTPSKRQLLLVCRCDGYGPGRVTLPPHRRRRLWGSNSDRGTDRLGEEISPDSSRLSAVVGGGGGGIYRRVASVMRCGTTEPL